MTNTPLKVAYEQVQMAESKGNSMTPDSIHAFVNRMQGAFDKILAHNQHPQ